MGLTDFQSILAVSVALVLGVAGFPSGPPITEFVCKDMFPVGHGFDAQYTEPPYAIRMSQNVYTPWEELRITVSARRKHIIRGILVQARRADCTHPKQKEPVGTFQLLPGEFYLQTVPCLNRVNSSLTHRSNPGLLQAVFKWFAPAVSVGHIYFVATIVEEKSTFWTTVHSEILRDLSKEEGGAICPSRMLLDPTGPKVTTSSPDKVTGGNHATNLNCSPLIVILLLLTMIMSS